MAKKTSQENSIIKSDDLLASLKEELGTAEESKVEKFISTRFNFT